MPDKPSVNGDIDYKWQALLGNANAARLVAQTIEGTLGPKGLDIMMVDSLGDVVISNDGVTILKAMAVSHPVARMIINAARAQQAEVGDGTTTATILAGALVTEGSNQVIKGVPVTQVIAGIKLGLEYGIERIESQNQPVESLDDPLLLAAAKIAGRDQEDIAALVIEAARIMGRQRLHSPDFRFADTVVAREASASQVFSGNLISKVPLNLEMPRFQQNVKILIIDDALAPEELEAESRVSEAGFQYYLQVKKQYEDSLAKIIALGVNLVIVDRSVDAQAEQVFTEAGIAAIQRVSQREIDRVCQHTGARKIKRSGLLRPQEQIAPYLGQAGRFQVDDKKGYTLVLDGCGEPWATVLIGAATEEVVDERERIARDAAAAVQAAVQQGLVPGGGAIEVWTARQLEDLAQELKGMASYGVLAVKEALLRPFSCIVANAGFNPLEKIGDVVAEQKRTQKAAITVDCEGGNLIDAFAEGIVDPTRIKTYAVRAAGEVATAILRINTVIKMHDEEPYPYDIR